jgi:endonuclease-3
MNAQKRQAIFARFQSHNPYPTTELIYHSTFQLLIAVMLSAQATDKSVNLVTPKLFAIANTPTAMLKLGITGVKEIIKSIGLFNTKAANIIKTCQLLVTNHHSQIPNTREELEALPGVGRKTANVILNTAFNQPTIAVDTHIFRVANRTQLACGKTPLAVEKNLARYTPKDYLHNAHHWLVLHGRYVCTARKPQCPTCIIKNLCEHPNKTI